MEQKSNKIDMIHSLSRLKWACRRGMLELDVLLGNFLESGYADLTEDDKKLFINLLGCEDPELFSWLMGRETPSEKGLERITGIIRKHAKSRV